MIAVRLPAPAAIAQLIDALMVAGGAVPVPDNLADRQGYLALAHALDAADAARLRRPAVMTAGRRDGGNVAAAADVGDTTNRPTPDGTSEHGGQDGGQDGADPNGAGR